ncbi:MAG: RNA-binding protein [Verrucomicrobiales bacterium]
MTEDEVRDLFIEFGGAVELHMPLDRDSGRPRGFAFVTLQNQEFGEAAIGSLNGHEIGGRPLRVSEAVEREQRGGGGGGGYRGGGGGGYRGGGGGGGGYRGGGGGGRGGYGDRRGGGGGGYRGGGGGGERRERRSYEGGGEGDY